MSLRLPFRHLEPTFFAGLLDDPLLLVRIRPAGSNLLFDCGQVHHLAKRVMTGLQALFISHTHMDHWMGIDSIIRHLHAAPKTIDLFGPPGLADKLQHKLAGYDWNLAEEYWGDIRVHEIEARQIVRSLFRGRESFRRHVLEEQQRDDPYVYRTPHLQVSAALCAHRVPSLIYRLDERPTFLIDRQKLADLDLVPGPWLGELKRRFLSGDTESATLKVTRRGGNGVREEVVTDLQGLVAQLQRPQQPASLGYISDVGFSEENRAVILSLMRGVDLLISECTFLAAAREKARASWHLCTGDVNELLHELQPEYYLPMHLSKSYSRHTEDLYRELAPPAGTRILQLPAQITPRPLLAREVEWQVYADP